MIFKISVIGFGGGNAIFPIIKNQAIDKYHWITESELEDIIVVTNSIPGASAVEAISYIAIKAFDKKWKGVVATFFGLLPHVFIFFGIYLLGVSFLPIAYLNIVYVAVIPIIVVMLMTLTIKYFKTANKELTYPIFMVFFVISIAFNFFIPTPYNIPIILICAIIIFGVLFEFWKQHYFKKHPPQTVIKPTVKPDVDLSSPEYRKFVQQISKNESSKLWALQVFNHIDLQDINKKYKLVWTKNGIYFRPKWGYVFKEVTND